MEPVATETGAVRISLGVVDGVTQSQALGGIHARVCNGADPECALGPVDEADSDENDLLVVHGPVTIGDNGFSGLVELTRGAAGTSDSIAALVAFSPPVPSSAYYFVPMLTRGELDLLTLALPSGWSFDPDHGYAAIEVVDCFGASAPGVEATEVPDGGQVVYVASHGIKTTGGTSEIGTVLVLGLAPTVAARITLSVAGKRVATLELPIRAGFLTMSHAYPTP